MEFRLATAALIVVVATYVFLGWMGDTEFGRPATRDAAYNLLSRGLLSGQLSLDMKAPALLAGLRDPYDPAANAAARDPRDRLNDLSYYRGKLYLYFGIAPALLVFIPWHLVTGGWLAHWTAAVLLCCAGLLVNLSLLRAVQRRVFPGAPPWAFAACTLILGFASYGPLLLARADMWEIPIAFNYLALSIALRCLWEAYGTPERASGWIAGASLSLGLAFASRLTVLPGMAILLLPFVARETRRSARAWAAASLPLAACGAGVALYNLLRFGSPFDFGRRYQLASEDLSRVHSFSLSYLATNLKFYLFQAVHWSGDFPFAEEPPKASLLAHLPPNHGDVQHIAGALLNAPILWAALAVPLLFRSRHGDRSLLLLVVSAAWIALASLGLLSVFYGVCSRYQFEFLPALALLASLGVLGMVSVTDPLLRGALRCAWVPALLVSTAFPVLYGIDRCVVDHNTSGITYMAYGDLEGARREFDVARALSPGNPGSRLGSALMSTLLGRSAQAQALLEALVRDRPDDGIAHFALGNVLAGQGRKAESLAQYRSASRLNPADPAIRSALDAALAHAK